MAIPLCLDIPAIPDPFSLPMPGGIELEDVNVMRVLQPALTPLMPMFEIVDTIVALYNCVKAIPDALGPPPDPTVLAACLPELGKKLGKLLMLAPQVALPRLIERCLALTIEALRTVSSQQVPLASKLSGKPLDEAVPEIDRMIKLLEAAHGAVPGVFP